MKPLGYIIAIVGAVSVLSLGAMAQSDDESHTHHQHFKKDDDNAPGPHPGFGKALNLTDAQKKTLADARTAQQPVQQALHEKIRAAHDALQQAGNANAGDAELTTLANNLAALIAQEEVARVKAHQQLVSILTPEQQQKLAELESEHKDERPPFRHPHA